MKQWDKAAVYRLLTERGIWHEITEHPAVYNMEEICDQLADRLQGDTNNLLTLTLAFPGEGPPQTP